MDVLNLYSGLGGNRRLWENVNVTAIENNPELARFYGDTFPDDTVIIEDAHQYLLNHFKEFDFIWSSPPCQSHSSFRHNICVRFRGTPPMYPDMTLYQEILLLQYNAVCPWVVENVKPYYEPLIPAQFIQRHMFWSNITIPPLEIDREELHGFNLEGYRIPNKRQVLRNCVRPKLGLHVKEALTGV